MTPDLLRRAIGCTAPTAEQFAGPLTAACAFYGIDTPARLAMFLATIGHESQGLRLLRELWGPTDAQVRYERDFHQPWPSSQAEAKRPEFARNRKAWELGNTEPGDGRRFCGHGAIQTTGRANHARARDRLRERFPHLEVPDFEAYPEALMLPQWAALSAADYCDMRGLNAVADAGDFETYTRLVNGGLNGYDDRLSRWEKVKAVLGGEPQFKPGNNLPAETPLLSAGPEKNTEPETPQETWRSEPIPLDPVNPTESDMDPLTLGLLMPLARTAIEVFSPLAREKLTKEMDRHTDKPEVAAQIAEGVINAVKVATGQTDPVHAVSQLKADATVVPKAEAGALDTLAKLQPVLEQLAALDKAAWDASEASMDAAAKRAQGLDNDQDVFLTRSIVGMVLGVMLALGVLLGVMQGLKASDGTIGTILGLFSMACGVVFGEFKTRYQHRYGTSRSSAAKDVLMGELSKRK